MKSLLKFNPLAVLKFRSGFLLLGFGLFATAYAAPAVPVLNGPANNATGLPLTDTLSWSGSAGAATYRVQLSTDSTFTTTTVNDSTVTGTTRAVGPLTSNTIYYWRVNAKDSTGISAFSTRRTFTTILGTPILTTPANNVTSIALSSNLNWIAVTGAINYRMQLSTDSTFTTTTIDDSTLTTTTRAVGPLASGTVYYWHVNARNAAGTGAFSTRRSFTTLTIPVVPALNIPAANATNIAVSSNLTWGAVSGAATYRVQLSTDSTFATTTIDDSTVTTATRATGTLINNTVYYWRVNAKNAIGTSAFSARRNFTTIAFAIPAAPTLTTPAANATNVALSSNLTWNASTNAATYRVQLSTDSTFATTTMDDSTLTTTTRAVGPLTAGTVYYWRVNAKDSLGTSAFSTRRSFTTLAAPAIPALNVPAANATNIAVSSNLTWGAVSGAATYRVQLSPDSTFTTTTVDDSTVTTATRTTGALINNTVYYWRVNAKNAVGTSAFSTRRNFTTVALTVPAVPALNTPTQNATNIATSTNMIWNASTNAVAYRVQLSTDSTFATTTVDDSTLTTTTRAVGPLTNNTVYYWRVNAKDSIGTSAFSTRRTFTTIAASPPSIPALSSPANNATALPINDTLAWTDSTGALTYRVQLSTDSTFTTTLVNDSTLTTTVRVVGPLASGTTYYWRVNAKNAVGTSVFSSRRNFSTISVALTVPTLNSPASNATGLALTDTLKWTDSTAALSFRVQLSTDSNFATTTVNDSTLTTTSRVVSSLTNGTLYYWRVNAKYSGGTSAFSARRNFTTLTAAPSAPTLISPANNTTNLPLTDTLKWNASTGALTYRVQLSTDSTFATATVNDSTLTTASRVVGPLANGTFYYWRVNAKNASGTSAFSIRRSFSTVDAALAVPTLIGPTNNARGLSTGDTLTWTASPGATTYRVELSTDSTFITRTTIDDSTVTTTSRVTPPLAIGTLYYWRVNAKNSSGTSAFSASRNFGTALVSPILITPINNDTTVALAAVLKWTASTGGVTYHVQVSIDSNFATTVVNDSADTIATKTTGSLTSHTLYYWRVSEKNSTGTSAYSSRRSFTTLKTVVVAPPVLAMPTLMSPANNALGIPTDDTLNWADTTGALTYHFQLSRDSTFATTLVNDSSIATTFKSVTGLTGNTVYYWRVNAKNTVTTTAYSAIWKFTTIVPIPLAIGELSRMPDLSVASGNILQFSLAQKSRVEVTLFDSEGRQVLKVIDEDRNAGHYNLPLSTAGLRGAYYLIDFKAGAFHKTMKIAF